MRKGLFYTVAALLVLLASLAAAETLTGKVVVISDGDTIAVLVDGKTVKVRLDKIDCPEKGQPFGTKAKQFTSGLAYGKTVTVQTHGKDRYGRVIGEVKLPDGKSLNTELVRAGLAWRYVKYAPKDTALQNLEAQARNSRLGLWADLDTKTPPIAPWEWRNKAKGKQAPAVASPTPTPASTKIAIGAAGSSGEPLVYVTATGKCYHAAGCRYLKKGSRAMSLSQAQVEGYSACKVCDPE